MIADVVGIGVYCNIPHVLSCDLYFKTDRHLQNGISTSNTMADFHQFFILDSSQCWQKCSQFTLWKFILWSFLTLINKCFWVKTIYCVESLQPKIIPSDLWTPLTFSEAAIYSLGLPKAMAPRMVKGCLLQAMTGKNIMSVGRFLQSYFHTYLIESPDLLTAI